MLRQFMRSEMGNRLCILNMRTFLQAARQSKKASSARNQLPLLERAPGGWVCWLLRSQGSLSRVRRWGRWGLKTGFHIHLLERCHQTRAVQKALGDTRAHSALSSFQTDTVVTKSQSLGFSRGLCKEFHPHVWAPARLGSFKDVFLLRKWGKSANTESGLCQVHLPPKLGL